jgi:hypothetical protein
MGKRVGAKAPGQHRGLGSDGGGNVSTPCKPVRSEEGDLNPHVRCENAGESQLEGAHGCSSVSIRLPQLPCRSSPNIDATDWFAARLAPRAGRLSSDPLADVVSHGTWPVESRQLAAAALLADLSRLVGLALPNGWDAALSEVARRHDPLDLLLAMPRSSHERRALRESYRRRARRWGSRGTDWNLRALDACVRAATVRGSKRRRPPWELLDPNGPLPTSVLGCDREIYQRFTAPGHRVRRLVVQGANTVAQLRDDVLRGIEQEWCLTVVPRDEIIAVDVDSVKVADVARAVEKLRALGCPTIAILSGRGLQAVIDARNDFAEAESSENIGYHILSVTPDARTKQEALTLLRRTPGFDIRERQHIRLPLGPYKTIRVTAPRSLQHVCTHVRSADDKRLHRSALRNVKQLQGIVALLRRLEPWSGEPLRKLDLEYPSPDDVAGWSRMRRAALREAARELFSDGRKPPVAARSDDVRRSSDGPCGTVIPYSTRRLLDEGDVEGMLTVPDGSRTDRSRMGFIVLHGLRAAGLGYEAVEQLVDKRKPGLAVYWQRSNGLNLLTHDWIKLSRIRPRDDLARSVGHALASIEGRDLIVFLALASIGDAPGVRRLREATGYCIATVGKALKSLESARFIRKVGPTRGPGHRFAQRWEFVPPPEVYTCSTPPLYRQAVKTIDEVLRRDVPLVSVLPPGTDAHHALTEFDADRLAAAAGSRALEDGVARVHAARARHETERAQYHRRLRRAREAGVVFLPKAAALIQRRDNFEGYLSRSLTQGEFNASLERARQRLPRRLYESLLSIESPDDRHRRWVREVREAA